MEKIILNSTIHDSLPPNTVLKSNKNYLYMAFKIGGEMTGKFRLIMNSVRRLSRDDDELT